MAVEFSGKRSFLERISCSSERDFTPMTLAPGISRASATFSSGTMMFLIPIAAALDTAA